ncbi:MAG: pyridoxamine 5'-phosphate oxidase family protein [Kineosporiaceae bacterium]
MSTQQPQQPDRYAATARTTASRKNDRLDYDVDAVAAVLDEALTCHVGYVVDGSPVVLPQLHARVGRTLYLHSSTGATLGRLARAGGGVELCVTVTLVDGLVLARSQFNHSLQYRSVIARGRATLVTDPAERAVALAALVEHVVPGRSRQSRPASPKEDAATAVLRLPLVEVSLKARPAGVDDDPADLGLSHWAGVLPVRTTYGAPQPTPDLDPSIPVPQELLDYRRG